MSWYDRFVNLFGSSSDPQAKVDAARKKVDDAKRELEAAEAELSGAQQGQALSGATPLATGGKRHKSKKTRRGKKVKGTRRH